MQQEINFKHLLELAALASKNAYAPYSKFFVGACVLFDSGKVYSGCNVENASYGLTLCAERNALSNAIAQGEKGKLLAVAIHCQNAKECYPCGACRQWIVEFSKDALVIVEDITGKLAVHTIIELLPKAFTSSDLHVNSPE